MDMNADRLRFVRERLKVRRYAGSARRWHGRGAIAGVDRRPVGGRGDRRHGFQQVDEPGAWSYCAFAGRLVYVGITQQELSFLHAPVLHRRELTILASRNALPGDFKPHHSADRRRASGHRDPGSRIERRSRRRPRSSRAYLDPKTGVIKAMIAVG
jgi:threonine dehydrogenase-like Zn-dependent dehydrogenase